MLEQEDELLTWALEKLPTLGDSIPAAELPPHRTAYLDYEGPVSRNRGTVTRWDRGEFHWRSKEKDRYVVELQGVQLQGTATLNRQTATQWLVEFES